MIKSICTQGVTAAAGLLLAASQIMAQGYGSPTVLPLPPVSGPSFEAQPEYVAANYRTRLVNAEEPNQAPPAPEDAPPQPPADTEAPQTHLHDPASAPAAAAPAAAAPATLGCTSAAGCSTGASCISNDCACGDGWSSWCGPNCNRGWFGSAAGLVMGRDHANKFWTSYESDNNANQTMNTDDADSDWTGGFQVGVGKWFCPDSCGRRNGIEAQFFWLGDMNGFSQVDALDPTAGGNWVSSTIDMNDVGGPIEFPNGREVDDYFDNAMSQRIWRSNTFYGLEVNFLNQYWNPASDCQITWIAGVRWFHMGEDLTYGSVAGESATGGPGTSTWGNNGGVDEAFMHFNTTNDLVGFQLGTRADYYVTQRWSFFVTPKFGLYGNYMTADSIVETGDGSQLYDISADASGASFLGSVDVGTSWQFTQNWRAFVGYKAIAVTGVALSDNQIPHYLAAVDEMSDVDTNGSLILHGGFAGLEFCY